MASGDIKIYTMGHSGVVLDPNHLEPTLPEDALRKAQNTTHDPANAHSGAIRKRPGLKQFGAFLGGSILGGIPMPVAGTGGAPATGGGGFTGDSTGSGGSAPGDPGTGAPGAGGSVGGHAGDTGSTPTYPPPGAALFNGGVSIFGGKRLIVIGRSNDLSSNDRGVGWFVAPEDFSSNATELTAPGPPSISYLPPHAGPFNSVSLQANPGKPFVVDPSTGYLYYSKSHNQEDGSGAVVATIRKTNGAVDSLVATIPRNPATTADIDFGGGTTAQSMAVMDMSLGSNGTIYVVVKDKAAKFDTNTSVGRLFSLNPSSGALTEINTSTTVTVGNVPAEYDHLPYCCAYFNRRLFWGEYDLINASGLAQKDTNATVRSTDTGFTYAPDNHGFSDGEVVTAMCTFPSGASNANSAILFVGFGTNKTAPAMPKVYTRRRVEEADTTAWNGGANGGSILTPTGGAATNGAFIVSLIEFKGCVYASFWNPAGVSKIYKFTPAYTYLDTDGYWDGSGTWSAVITAATVVPYNLYRVVNDSGSGTYLYAIGSNGVYGSITSATMITTDGTTWTESTSTLPTGSHSSYPISIFGDFAQ